MSRDRIIHVALPSRHVYDIRIGSGALSALSSTARDLECKRALVISDENVGPAYGKLVKKRLRGGRIRGLRPARPTGRELEVSRAGKRAVGGRRALRLHA